MTTNITWYDNAIQLQAGGFINFATGTFKVTLHTSSYTPNVLLTGNKQYADLTNELSTANGYTNGGQTLTSLSLSASGLNVVWTSVAPSWTASGGNITARYAVVRAVGSINGLTDPLLFYILLDNTPADVTATNGNPITLTPDPTNGWVLITGTNN